MIHLACTKGNIGYWDYYNTVMKISDVVSENRIITVAESSELYTENINSILQREIKMTRIKNIATYINSKDERFLGNIVVAIHKGNPKWTEIDITQNFEVSGTEISPSSVDFLSSKFGVLTLSGNEQIFALDGQHRLLGLRKAFADNEELGSLELSITFVVHNHGRLEKTRRLFTVLNKYAEKPRGAELIILDEDDAAAIISRRLATEHEVLSKPNGISNSKTGAIHKSDNTSFTTLVTINNINKVLFALPKAFYHSRPEDNILETLYAKAALFWDTIFRAFPILVEYIDGEEVALTLDELPIYRNHELGGSLLLRPAGHLLLAQAFIQFNEGEIEEFVEKVKLIDFRLSGNIWKYIFWNQKMLTKEGGLKKDMILFLLGKFDNEEHIHIEMSRIYEMNNLDYERHIEPVTLEE